MEEVVNIVLLHVVAIPFLLNHSIWLSLVLYVP